MEENQGNLMGDDGDFVFEVIDTYTPPYNLKRGRALIFNQENFNSSLGIRRRSGSAIDSQNLVTRLEDLRFEVSLFNDLTVEQLTTEIAKCKTNSHIFHSKFFLIYIIFKC